MSERNHRRWLDLQGAAEGRVCPGVIPCTCAIDSEVIPRAARQRVKLNGLILRRNRLRQPTVHGK